MVEKSLEYVPFTTIEIHGQVLCLWHFKAFDGAFKSVTATIAHRKQVKTYMLSQTVFPVPDHASQENLKSLTITTLHISRKMIFIPSRDDSELEGSGSHLDHTPLIASHPTLDEYKCSYFSSKGKVKEERFNNTYENQKIKVVNNLMKVGK